MWEELFSTMRNATPSASLGPTLDSAFWFFSKLKLSFFMEVVVSATVVSTMFAPPVLLPRAWASGYLAMDVA